MDTHGHYHNVLWQQRIHVAPDALDGLPAQQGRIETVWDLGLTFLKILAPLPDGMLRWWLAQPRGHIVIHSGESRYVPGTQIWRGNSYESVLYISAEQAAGDSRESFLLVMRLLDDLLGEELQAARGSFSDGCGSTQALTEAAQRFSRLAQLGYGSDLLGADSPSDYLAQTLYLALAEPQELNRLNPLLLKLYQQTLLSEGFWVRQR
ncbi:MAG: hypothetical protein LLG44_09230 [Chloroflexi bacterium]|nr:hypothetical protein [Chloroflexota bacterium]